MKLRVVDRIIAAIAGLMLAVLSVIPVADTLFNVGILDRLARIAEFKLPSHIVFMVGGGAALLLVGILCLRIALRRAKRQGFVVQTTDVGELSISIRAIEDLVNQCVSKHDELHVSSTVLENTRDGLVISLRIGLASGVNIPLAVSALQKQIKQYVTACSGVDVYEVKVQVEATSAKGKASIYAVPDMLDNPAPLPREEVQQEIPAEPVAEMKEPEEKCLHQRLFGEEEQPAIVPMPPAEETAEETEPEIPSEEAVEAWEENVPADEAIEEWEKKVPADEIIEAWEKAEEEAAEAVAAADLDTLSGLTDEIEETESLEALAEYEVEAESIADLEALDGAEASAEDEE